MTKLVQYPYDAVVLNFSVYLAITDHAFRYRTPR